MWWDLSIHTTEDGLRWDLRSVNIPHYPGTGIWRWQRSGSLVVPCSERTSAASAIGAALRSVLEALGEAEHLSARGGQTVLPPALDVRLVVGDQGVDRLVGPPGS
jgi:hypothetical protein